MHTSGPWLVQHQPREKNARATNARTFHIYTTQPSGHTAGLCDTAAYEWAVTPSAHAANAHLIAAAPDLLAALQEIVEYQAATMCGASRLWERARAAIAKARGE